MIFFMKKFFGLFLLFGLTCVSPQVDAQTYHISSRGKPILKGDSVLVYISWAKAETTAKIDFNGFYSPDETDIKNRQFAFYIYPQATRVFSPRVQSVKGNTQEPCQFVKTLRKIFTVIVLDENGKEIRDEYSDVVNTSVDFRKLDVAGKTREEVEAAYGLTHKEVIRDDVKVENSETTQKKENLKEKK
jgi:hypothetical protein